jgi:hypothetical protein
MPKTKPKPDSKKLSQTPLKPKKQQSTEKTPQPLKAKPSLDTIKSKKKSITKSPKPIKKKKGDDPLNQTQVENQYLRNQLEEMRRIIESERNRKTQWDQEREMSLNKTMD